MRRYVLAISFACVVGIIVGVIVGRLSLWGRLEEQEKCLQLHEDRFERMTPYFDRLGNRTVWDARSDVETCHVHNIPLVLDTVPVVYGLLAHISELEEAREKDFPHANTMHAFGCVVMSWKEALVRYCPSCRKAEKRWKDKP